MNVIITASDNITDIYISISDMARTLPKRYAPIPDDFPASDDTAIPNANAADDAAAMAISPAVLYFRLTVIITNEAMNTEGTAAHIGGISSADDIEREAKPISDRP